VKIPWGGLDESHHIVLHNHPGEGGFLLPSDADIAIARELGTPGYGFYLASNDGMRWLTRDTTPTSRCDANSVRGALRHDVVSRWFNWATPVMRGSGPRGHRHAQGGGLGAPNREGRPDA